MGKVTADSNHDWKTGVYCIRNLLNGKRYVGSSSTSLVGRLRYHRKSLRGGYCHNRHLQSSWKKYGASVFRFSILERCAPEDCIRREQYWMDYFRSSDSQYGYNISPTAGSLRGTKLSAETCRRISLSKKGHPAWNKGLKGVCILSEETKRKMSKVRKGKKHSPESIEKMREVQAKIARGRSPDVLEKLRKAVAEANKTRVISKETRKKMSAVHKGKFYGPPLKGERNGRAKLTVEKVLDIRRECRTWNDCVRKAKELGLGVTAVYEAMKGTHWGHVV